MSRLRRALKWFRIEDETGVLSLTTIAFAAGLYGILSGKHIELPALAAFAITLAGYHAKKAYVHREKQKAADLAHEEKLHEMTHDGEQAIAEMSHAHDEKVVAISENAETLAQKIAVVEKKIADIATPERLEALRKGFGR